MLGAHCQQEMTFVGALVYTSPIKQASASARECGMLVRAFSLLKRGSRMFDFSLMVLRAETER